MQKLTLHALGKALRLRTEGRATIYGAKPGEGLAPPNLGLIASDISKASAHFRGEKLSLPIISPMMDSRTVLFRVDPSEMDFFYSDQSVV